MDNNMGITVRTAETRDFDDVFRLLKQLWPDEKLDMEAMHAVFSRGIESRDDKFFCAKVNDKVVGFCALYIRSSFWQEGRLGYIGELIVDGPFRGRGVGTALLSTSSDKAREMGCRKIELDSVFSRTDAHEFYEKIGFKKRAYLFSRDL